jgi:hypothetical protein
MQAPTRGCFRNFDHIGDALGCTVLILEPSAECIHQDGHQWSSFLHRFAPLGECVCLLSAWLLEEGPTRSLRRMQAEKIDFLRLALLEEYESER